MPKYGVIGGQMFLPSYFLQGIFPTRIINYCKCPITNSTYCYGLYHVLTCVCNWHTQTHTQICTYNEIILTSMAWRLANMMATIQCPTTCLGTRPFLRTTATNLRCLLFAVAWHSYCLGAWRTWT